MNRIFLVLTVLVVACGGSGERPSVQTDTALHMNPSVRSFLMVPDSTPITQLDSVRDSIRVPVYRDSIFHRLTLDTVDWAFPPPPADTTPVPPSPPPPPPPVSVGGNEPKGFTRITERDFAAIIEDGWTNCHTTPANFAVVLRNDAPRRTSKTGVASYRAGWDAGSGPICLKKDFGREYDQVYLDFDVGTSINWYGQTVLDKIGYVLSTNSASGPLFFGIRGPQNAPQTLEVHTSAMVPNVAGNSASGNRNFHSAGRLTRGRMHRVSMLITMNTCQPFVANGGLEVWVDGKKVIDQHTVAFRGPGARSGCHGWRGTKWSPIWGGTSGTTPAVQEMYMGYFYVSGR